jgi:signal transduction histidine kinase
MTGFYAILGFLLGCLLAIPLSRLFARRAEARTREAERKARGAERLAELGAMTSGLAHEIKNPLSTVGLNAQLLEEALCEIDIDDVERQRLLKRLSSLAREVDRLRDILTDFLQFAGRVKLHPHRQDLVQLVDDLTEFFQPQCDRAGVVLRTQLPGEPVELALDGTLFKQALLNLMINATQAMAPHGDTSPRVDEDDHGTSRDLILRVDADAQSARVHVIDTGPGIDDETMQNIFHPYVSHKRGGSGLGLPTARRIIEEHGGTLTAHSDVGRGSDFVITLPRGDAASDPS